MNYLLRLFLVVLFIPGLVACFISDKANLREGIDSFRVEEYRTAFVRLKPLAKKGQADAQYAVGYMYYYGKGVVEDRKKAWFWITAAANAGQPDALVAAKMLDGNMNTK
ncbi:MAG: SEL1-like repeat protein [Legionella sp.]|uniref:sel1 repeat family protein n=1 Tax=Legionella sp. TaxID=459 RepID=UPI0039E4FF2F